MILLLISITVDELIIILSLSYSHLLTEFSRNPVFKSIEDIIRYLDSLTRSNPSFIVKIRRGFVLESVIVGIGRSAFGPYRPLQVWYNVLVHLKFHSFLSFRFSF